ncbi:MAG: [citrate (pro-3S)-lyase] ligase [Candidatus Heimdallarchaeota archaeon]|nr:[citrate (pro-3S)-lyase] ligase [Candidatus Heimdallarchaeota archaeon]
MTLPGYLDEFYENPTPKQRKIFADFLKKQGLEYEDSVEMSLKVTDESTHTLVGTGSIEGKVIKCVSVDPKRRGEGLSAHILSLLVKEQFNRGRTHIFVFTNPKNIEETAGNVFAGFRVVAKTNEVVLLEMGFKSVNDYLNELKFKTRGIKENGTGPIGAIVVNCNPFTLGHKYLIETAAKECHILLVFVVMEDKSAFPTNVRFKLVKEGTKHIENVIVLEGGEYIISPATFPRYFMKEYDNIALSQARLDVTIFGELIAPALGITRRYVGEEPFDLVTNSYNQAMKEILIPKGIELKILPRKEINGEAISASKVRRLLKEDKIEETISLVPPTTYNFFFTNEAKPIINKIKKTNSRH